MKIIQNILVSAAVLLTALAAASAQAYPVRPVKIIVPYAAGGPVDQLARGLAEQLGKSMGQAFVVENKPGANAMIGASHVAKSPADGHTLFMASSASLAVNPLIYSKMTYDPDRDFAAISLLAQAPLAMVVNAGIPAKNLKELVTHIKTSEGKFAYASNGNGNPLHLACALFGQMANLDMVHVPYNGTAPALASLLAGDTQMACDIVLSSMPQIKAGKLKPIGIIGPKRVGILPQVPTLAEEGLAGVDATVWFALVAPRDTPAPVVTQLNQHVTKALGDAQLRERFAAMAMDLQASSPAELQALTQKERAKWAKVVERHKIKVD
jgi:tripartite-type tricarboxylate transporter receptor subunit TctC